MKKQIEDLTVVKMGTKHIVIIPTKNHESFPLGSKIKIVKE